MTKQFYCWGSFMQISPCCWPLRILSNLSMLDYLVFMKLQNFSLKLVAEERKGWFWWLFWCETLAPIGISLLKGGRVEPPITEHVPITKHFPIFLSFPNQIELFLCYWRGKLEGYKCSLSCRSKEEEENTGKGLVIVWFNVFEKVTLDSSLVPALYLWALEAKKKKTQEEVKW